MDVGDKRFKGSNSGGGIADKALPVRVIRGVLLCAAVGFLMIFGELLVIMRFYGFI